MTSQFIFPIGYYKFHKNQLFNYQLIRWHSMGYAKFEDFVEAGKKIKTFADWKQEMLILAEKALEEQAQNHCQIGNIGLSLDTMLKWIEEIS